MVRLLMVALPLILVACSPANTASPLGADTPATTESTAESDAPTTTEPTAESDAPTTTEPTAESDARTSTEPTGGGAISPNANPPANGNSVPGENNANQPDTGPWLIRWLVALGPGAPGGNHNVRLFAFHALQRGDCKETVTQGGYGDSQERALYRGVGSACLAAFEGRTDLWSQAESDFKSFDAAAFDFTCYDRAAFNVFEAVITAYRQNPDRNFVRAQGPTAADSCPRMSEVNPDHGSVDGGYEVTIIGENFPPETTVSIQNGTNVDVQVQSQEGGHRLTFTMPPFDSAGLGYLIVRGGGSDTGLEFTFEESSAASRSPSEQAGDSTADSDTTADAESTTEAPGETPTPNEPTDQPTDATDEPS
jgi:hypothetical protein